jgi:hypothetical protein
MQGDWFLDIVNSDLYEKTSDTVWTLRENIKGLKGDTGNTGATGPANQLSVDTVSASAPGSAPDVTIGGTAPSQTISFVLPTGDTGPTGPAPNLTIGTVSTETPGNAATATVTGTNPDYALNLGIPRGDKGEVGSQWLTGASAPTGTDGVVGDFYLVTGTPGTGDVYEKTDAATWTLEGNIRGAAGTGDVDSVNSVLPDVNGNVVLTWSDFTGTIPASALPSLATTEVYPVADEAAMLALSAQRGDLAIRTDLDETYILAGDDPSILSNWTVLASTGGNVRLTGDQTIGGIKTFTNAPVVPDGSWTIDKTSGLQTALDSKEGVIATGTTAQYYRGDKTWQILDKAAVGLSNVANLAQVDLVNAQTIAGIKTFSSAPIVPDASWTIANTNGLQGALDGKAATSHTHDASAIITGTLGIARIPTGTTGTTVALGNHLHTGVYEPLITAGTISQYRRGDNTWRDLGSDAVLLTGNQSVAGSKTFTSGAEFTSSVLAAAGLTNASARPAVGTGRIAGEISGRGATSVSDDGFLRLSAGGGTSAARSYIDISGHSTVTDMNRNIVFGTENVERLRIKSTEILSAVQVTAPQFNATGTGFSGPGDNITGVVHTTGNETIAGVKTFTTAPLVTLGNNTFKFSGGPSLNTPTFSFGNSTGKSVALLTGATGGGVTFDDTGTFYITKETKANIDAGTSTGGTPVVTVTTAGNFSTIGSITSGGNLTVPGTSYQTFGNTGLGAPTFTTRSAGTKIVLYDGVGASTVDSAIGMETGFLWNSVSGSGSGFKWYAGTTNVATLTGTGNLSTAGTITSTGQGTFSGGITSTIGTFSGAVSTARHVARSDNTSTAAFGGGDPIEVRNDTGYPAITFHKAGAFAPQIRAVSATKMQVVNQAGSAVIDFDVAALAVDNVLTVTGPAYLNAGTRRDVFLGTNADDWVVAQEHLQTGNVNNHLLKTWMRRRSAGGDWITADVVVGIAIDSSYNTPNSSRSWWRRNAQQGLQEWGDAGTLTFGLNSTSLSSYKFHYHRAGTSEKQAVASGTTGTVTLDVGAASVYTLTPTGNVTTLSLTGAPVSGNTVTVSLIVSQGATPYTIATPSGGVFVGAATPTQVANKKCVFTYLSYDGGSSWLCSAAVQV